jgi:hypothetical protein
MRRARPDLIVPIRDRRQHKRYFTLRNAGLVFLIGLLGFAAITIYSEIRPSTTTGNYGRLIEPQLPTVEQKQKPFEVVSEAPPPVADQTVPDPMLVAPMAREQWLYGETHAASVAQPVITPVEPARPGDSRIAIVGGAEGVTVVQQTRRRPVLSGGFGRQ